MTAPMQNRATAGWHFANGCLGTLVAAASSLGFVLIVGLLTGHRHLIAEKLFMPSLAIACCFTIVFLAKRVARRLLPDSEGRQFEFGNSFHFINIILALGFGFVLFFMSALSIPFLNPSGSHASALLLTSIAVILAALHMLASGRAARFIRKTSAKKDGANKSPKVIDTHALKLQR